MHEADESRMEISLELESVSAESYLAPSSSEESGMRVKTSSSSSDLSPAVEYSSVHYWLLGPAVLVVTNGLSIGNGDARSSARADVRRAALVR